MGNKGYNIDKNELINSYCSYYGVSQAGLQSIGGVSYGDFNAFSTANYQVSMTQTDFSNAGVGSYFTGDHALSVKTDDSGIYHTVIPLNSYSVTLDGVTTLYVEVFDPTLNRSYSVSNAEIMGVLNFSKTDLFGLQGYFGFEGGGSNGYVEDPGYESGYSLTEGNDDGYGYDNPGGYGYVA
jgi:hypothetical protein